MPLAASSSTFTTDFCTASNIFWSSVAWSSGVRVGGGTASFRAARPSMALCSSASARCKTWKSPSRLACLPSTEAFRAGNVVLAVSGAADPLPKPIARRCAAPRRSSDESITCTTSSSLDEKSSPISTDGATIERGAAAAGRGDIAGAGEDTDLDLCSTADATDCVSGSKGPTRSLPTYSPLSLTCRLLKTGAISSSSSSETSSTWMLGKLAFTAL
mmetsp:Transcript_56594/g.91616  ORF Transcript_56594/g.91616 Transcript_56594/m.91616 type:complete len:216 (+) Transcript_56594:385-1032(+)